MVKRRRNDSEGGMDINEVEEQEESSTVRPWERPANGGTAVDDEEQPSSSRNDDDIHLNVRGRNRPSDEEFEFLRTHAPHVDEGILQTLYRSEGNNPRRLESILVEVLGLENAIELILKFRNTRNNRDGQQGTSREAREEENRMRFVDRVLEMFPDADNNFVARRCQALRTEDDFNRFVNNVMLSGRYPVAGVVSPFSRLRAEADTTQHNDGDGGHYVADVMNTSVSSLSSLSSDTWSSSSDYDTHGKVSSSGYMYKKKRNNNNDRNKERHRKKSKKSKKTSENANNNNEMNNSNEGSARKRRRYDSNPDDCLPSTSGASTSGMSNYNRSQNSSYNFRKLPSREMVDPNQCLQWYKSKCLIKNIKKMNKKAARSGAYQRRRNSSSFSSSSSESADPSESEHESEDESRVSSSRSKSMLVKKSKTNPENASEAKGSPEKSEERATASTASEGDAQVRSETGEQKNNPTPEVSEEWIKKHTEELMLIFPETDPLYLRAQCRAFGGSATILNKFVLEKLENNDMPSRKLYDKRLEIERIRLRYQENFDPEEYLSQKPDPWAYYSDSNRDCEEYELLNMWYLKAKFKTQYVRVISKVLKKNKYNLYLSYRALLKRRNSRTRPRSNECCNLNSLTSIVIPFLEEVCFIEKETELRQYIDNKERERQARIEEAKKSGDMKQCQCCFDSEILKEDLICCPQEHEFCKSCVTKFIEIELGQGKTKFNCLYSCGEEMTVASLQKALNPKLFSKVWKIIQMEELKAAGIEGLIQCPHCNYAAILPQEVIVLQCQNSDCMKETCRFCQEPNHIPLKCDEVEKSDEIRMRTYIENKMTEALVRTCYNCNKMFVKEEGCNKMVCSCGAKMCYICRKPITDYSHFNGQGGIDPTKCPLYTTNDELHVELVRRVAEEAKAEILKANPNKRLKHDPTLYLPRRMNDGPIPGVQQGAGIDFGVDVVMGRVAAAAAAADAAAAYRDDAVPGPAPRAAAVPDDDVAGPAPRAAAAPDDAVPGPAPRAAAAFDDDVAGPVPRAPRNPQTAYRSGPPMFPRMSIFVGRRGNRDNDRQ